MFARKYRLPAKIRLDNSKNVHSPFFIVKISKNTLVHNRYGFIISKKIDKRATVRNRVKRRIRACIEELHPKMVTGYDLLFIIKKEAVEKTTEILFSTISEILIKEKILINEEPTLRPSAGGDKNESSPPAEGN